MFSRRKFFQVSAMLAAGVMLPKRWLKFASAPLPSFQSEPTLDPASIEKYAAPLVIPPAMPRTSMLKQKMGKNIDYYEIAVRQFSQQILPAGLPATTVWSYGSVNHPGTFNYPAFTIEAKYNRPLRVRWMNQLLDANGNYLPHLLPVDQTLHWANPGGEADTRGTDPNFYEGPVPIVTHVHGAHTTQESDGYPEAWYLPPAKNIPLGYHNAGTRWEQYRQEFQAKNNTDWADGESVYQYPNDQRATTLWYHDHALGLTRLNVYAGPAGFYLLRGGPDDLVLDARNGKPATLPGPAPALGDAPGLQYYEIPIVIQDRSFNQDGSLFFPDSRLYFDDFAGPYIPEGDSDISPIWNPEFFGNTIVVNGKTWPKLTVEPRRYRFRFLNGCNARFLLLKMAADPLAERPAAPMLPFWIIGTEGGFLPAPVQQDQLLIALAERFDVIVDFSGLPQGTEVFLINEAPDTPFGGGEPGDDFDPAEPETTGQVLKFVVGPRLGPDKSTPVERLVLPALAPLGASSITRQVSLNEESSATLMGEEGEPVGPRAALCGSMTTDAQGQPVPLPMKWMDCVTENPAVGATETWEIYNYTMDAHPIHLHLVMFQVLNRQAFDYDAESGAGTSALLGDPRPPEAWENGYKDTVIAYPGEVTRIKACFDLAGLYVWHCHIIDHEDNEMMRPYVVGPSEMVCPGAEVQKAGDKVQIRITA